MQSLVLCFSFPDDKIITWSDPKDFILTLHPLLIHLKQFFFSSVSRKWMTAGGLHYSPACSVGGTSPQGRSTGRWQSRCWMMPTGPPALLPSPMPPTPPSPPVGPTSTVMQTAEEEPVSISSELTMDCHKVEDSCRHHSAALPCFDCLHQKRLSNWILNRLRFWAISEVQL